MSKMLEKPFKQSERNDFIYQEQYINGLHIEETEKALYALLPYERLEGDTVIDYKEEWEEEQKKKEREQRNQEIDNKIKELSEMASTEMVKGNIMNVETYKAVIKSLEESKV